MKFSEIIADKKPVLVDFFAEWCGPCKTMAPILKEVKDTVGDSITIIKLDVDKNPKVASAYQIQSIPTLILFKEGNIMWRKMGIVSKSNLIQLIQQHF